MPEPEVPIDQDGEHRQDVSRTGPLLRKARDYQKQRRGFAEWPHAFRRAWPRKEAKLERAHRHAVREQLAGLPLDQPGDQREDADPRLNERKSARKWSSGAPLREWVQSRLRNRTHRTAWNFFRRGYNKPRDRLRFIAFLNALIQVPSERASALAQHFAGLLEPPYPGPRESTHLRLQATPFLHSFFADEPTWQPRLRAWIERALK